MWIFVHGNENGFHEAFTVVKCSERPKVTQQQTTMDTRPCARKGKRKDETVKRLGKHAFSRSPSSKFGGPFFHYLWTIWQTKGANEGRTCPTLVCYVHSAPLGQGYWRDT